VKEMKSLGPVMFAAQIWNAKVQIRDQKMRELRPMTPASGVKMNGPAIQPASEAATVFSISGVVLL